MKIIRIAVMIAIISLVVSLLNCSHSHQENARKVDQKTIELIDLYRHEVSYQINNNWKLDEKINSDYNPKVKLVFRVMHSGEIEKIKYIEKSGYVALDKSAYLAIKKTNPTEPFPKEIKYPYMEIGIVFTPNGVKMKSGHGLYVKNRNFITADGYKAIAYQEPKTACRDCKLRSKCLRNPDTVSRQVHIFHGQRPASVTDKMREKIDTPEGRKIYGKRIGIVEPVFGNIRSCKRMDRFTLSGRKKVNIQWKLYCLVHNIEKILNYGESFAIV